MFGNTMTTLIMKFPKTFATLFFTFLLFLVKIHGSNHPLDPLTPFELNQVQTLVKKSHKNATFHYVGLEEPNKQEILTWMSQTHSKNSAPSNRKAYVVVRAKSKSHEIIVDLSKNSILSDEVYTGNGFPMLNNEEQTIASKLPHKYAPFQASIAKRGLNLSEVLCEVFTMGWYGEKSDTRKVSVLCYYVDGAVNFYMRPIEGIMAIADLDKMKIVDYRDRAVVPIPNAKGTDYRESEQNPPFDTRVKGMTISQPDGPSFALDGNRVRWANWDFHIAFDMRVGPVISLVSIYDHEKDKYRSVLYRGYVSEMFVPYQDMSEEWYFRTFLDAGEFGFGIAAMPLQPLTDCPKNAVFIDGYYTTRDGTIAKTPNVLCIFERYAGDIMWRHSESQLPEELTEVRPDITLVVRMVSTVANYDYIIDWEFKQSGAIKVTTSLSGMLGAKASVYTHKDQIEDEVYGTLVAQNLIGARHDHFLTFYLDLDIDGVANSLVKNELQTVRVVDETSPRKSYWKVNKEVAKTESEGKVQLASGATEIIVINPNKKTKIGNDIGYHLVPGPIVGPLLWKYDHQQIRGAFSNYNLWTTPYSKAQKWAGGAFVEQGHGTDTLAQWTLRDREIEEKDIVVWYTMGFHHVPVQEDYPIMPTVSIDFQLRPANFFEYNPVLKVKSAKPLIKWSNCSA
ncbi:amine oxidase [copper-containing] alpha 3, peroxisomal-like [Andrographis paniculata]|uniref:amine oxidase [copper-containing] alpha 3, peroxisomal-like n=1 Tax=Andrographis paniculata TaxID=175694 RepID=UPI0021E94FD0|nr:amine oxidase [copper-containing] alpha 3, peroxisomal-like [Andrographis paniculata]